MRSSRLVLILVTTLMVGIFVLPKTVSLFAGMHEWYYLDANPTSDVDCKKCHADIYEELQLSPLHKKWGDPTIADTKDCEACHRGNASITYANASSNQPGLEAHAATKADCTYCHFNTTNMRNAVHGNLSNLLGYDTSGCRCHNPDPNLSSFGMAGGFGFSNHPDDSGLNSTHLELILGTALDSGVYPGESEACIFCHTDVGVKFNVTTYTGYSITVSNNVAGNISEWSVSDISPTDFITYTEVK